MGPMDERKKNAGGAENERPIGEESNPDRAEREPGRGSDVEREGLTSRPQRYPGDGDGPTSDSPRPSSDESEAREDVEK